MTPEILTPILPQKAPPVAVLGAGSWGTVLAILLAANDLSVALWARDQELVDSLQNDRQNRQYLPGPVLSERIRPTADIQAAVEQAEVVFFAIPSGALRDVTILATPFLHPEAILVSAAKGLEVGTDLRMSQVIAEVIPGSEPRIVALSGPNLAVEMARGVPTASVAASSNPEAAHRVQRLFLGLPTFRVYTGHDVVGVELGGAIKNVIAIGAGICDGLGFGDNSKAALMTRGLMETIRLGTALGAESHTFLGLSGVGDLIATGASRLSRNYRVGFGLGQGKPLETILAELGQTAEGVPTTRVLHDLATRHKIEMPLCSALYEVLFLNRSAREVIQELMLRPPKAEND